MINYADQSYYYNEGVFYEPSGSGYTVVQAPSGAVVTVLPTGSTATEVTSSEYYYFGGVFYQQTNSGYKVVPAPVGAVVDNIPSGATEVTNSSSQTLLNYYGTYYLPIVQNGQDAYEVVSLN